MADTGNEDDFERVLFPYDYDRLTNVATKNIRFVHYTNADTAYRILSNRRIWMRNAITMNDYSEIAYGRSCLAAADSSGLMARFNSALDSVYPGLSAELHSRFNLSLPTLQFNTFLTSLSEHDDREDLHGRLSMWRAYGGANGVALVLRNAFLNNPTEINIVSSAVLYATREEFCGHFERVVKNMESYPSILGARDKENLLTNAFRVLQFATLCTKHPGFHEEREWRLIYTPTFGVSPIVEAGIEVVGGVPQTVNKIRLEGSAYPGLVGVEPSELLDSLIIGPTQFPMTLYDTFFETLKALAIPEPGSRIRISDIPLRR